MLIHSAVFIFATISITYYFWFHSNKGQSITLLKNWDCVAQTIEEDLMTPLIQSPYASASCQAWKTAPFSNPLRPCPAFLFLIWEDDFRQTL